MIKNSEKIYEELVIRIARQIRAMRGLMLLRDQKEVYAHARGYFDALVEFEEFVLTGKSIKEIEEKK